VQVLASINYSEVGDALPKSYWLLLWSGNRARGRH